MSPTQETREAICYFAYGSNMLAARLRGRVGSAKPIGRARLADRSLLFNKRGRDGSGKANLVEDAGAVVWGVLYQIRGETLATLDGFEPEYARTAVSVVLDHGRAVKSLTYLSYRLHDDPRPLVWYKRLVLQGAREHRLPDEYVRRLEAMPAVD
jgi:gamma-glutamylcyclotransferase